MKKILAIMFVISGIMLAGSSTDPSIPCIYQPLVCLSGVAVFLVPFGYYILRSRS